MHLHLKTLVMIVALATAILVIDDAEARGGGGRGGGGRGGGSGIGGRAGGGSYGGGRSMNRTPTMSRGNYTPRVQSRPQTQQVRQSAQNRPQTQQFRQAAQSRPQTQQVRQAAQNRPQAQVRQAAQTSRDQIRSEVGKYAQQAGSRGDRPAVADRQRDFSNQRTRQIADNAQISRDVSDRLQNRPGYNDMFNQDFFNNHDINPVYVGAGVGTGVNLWRAARWGTVAGWGAWNWTNPYYYDNSGYPVAVEPSQYASSNGYAPTPSQSAQTAPAQQTTPATEQANGDWLPLGVFAVGSNAKDAAVTNRFVQLALSRRGEIAGVFYNSSSDTAHDITGMVDGKTQQAHWALADRADTPIASTGLYNLTEDETPINVHFSDGSNQTWTLVRLQEG